MRILLSVLLLILCATTAQAQVAVAAPGYLASVPDSGRIAFRVVREEADIGTHVLTFRRDGGKLIVDIAVDLKVTAFGYVIYTYRHRGTEIWRDNRIVSVKTETDDNGTKLSVVAISGESGINVEAGGKQKVLPANYMPSSHWNPAWLSAGGLLNTATGEPVQPKVAGPTSEKITTARDQVEAARYTISSPRQAEIWFDTAGRWIKAKFVAADGSLIEYILQ